MLLRLVVAFFLFFVSIPMWADSDAPIGFSVDATPLSFKTVKGDVRFDVEIADTEVQREHGLMNRIDFPDNRALLFLYKQTEVVMMWMKNTPLSLDMIFVTKNGTIVAIQENTMPFSKALISSTVPVDAVIEVRAGTVQRIGLTIGDTVSHPRILVDHNAS